MFVLLYFLYIMVYPRKRKLNTGYYSLLRFILPMISIYPSTGQVNINSAVADAPIESEQFQLCSALIAQLVERVTSNDEVAGSTPS